MMAAARPTTKRLDLYLVYRANDQTARVVKNLPHLAWDEIAFNLNLIVPDPWGRLAGSIVIELPENGPPHIEVKGDGVLPQDTDAE